MILDKPPRLDLPTTCLAGIPLTLSLLLLLLYSLSLQGPQSDPHPSLPDRLTCWGGGGAHALPPQPQGPSPTASDKVQEAPQLTGW